MPKSARHRTLSLKQGALPEAPAGGYLAEIARLKDRLAHAKREIESLQARLAEDTTARILRPERFRERIAGFRHPTPDAPPHCLARITLLSLPEIIALYGDSAGDQAVRHVAHLLSGHVRATDLVGRTGTGAFGVVLSYADEIGARKKMQRLVEKIAATPCVWKSGQLPIELELSVQRLDREAEEPAANAA